mgnify:CR=1 FL=1
MPPVGRALLKRSLREVAATAFGADFFTTFLCFPAYLFTLCGISEIDFLSIFEDRTDEFSFIFTRVHDEHVPSRRTKRVGWLISDFVISILAIVEEGYKFVFFRIWSDEIMIHFSRFRIFEKFYT